jgi:hypothetical protein
MDIGNRCKRRPPLAFLWRCFRRMGTPSAAQFRDAGVQIAVIWRVIRAAIETGCA